MKGIILASHGKLADGLLDTLGIFSGELHQIKALCLPAGEDVSDFYDKLKTVVREVDTGDGVIIFCDLLFGSPCNCSARLLNDSQYEDNICIITGMNLAMVLEYVGTREMGMDNATIVDTGKQGIVDFTNMLAMRKSEAV